MEQNNSRRHSPYSRGSWITAFVVAMIAIYVAIMALVVTSDGPDMDYWPIAISAISRQQPEPYYQFTVSVFGIDVRSSTTSDSAVYEREIALWNWIPRIVFVLMSAIGGWFAGRILHHRLTRLRE